MLLFNQITNKGCFKYYRRLAKTPDKSNMLVYFTNLALFSWLNSTKISTYKINKMMWNKLKNQNIIKILSITALRSSYER